MRLMILATILVAALAHAGAALSVAQRAKLLRDQQKATEAVDKKYGNKKAAEHG